MSQGSQWFDGRARLVDLPRHRDHRGELLPLDFENLPFPPRRAFVVRQVPPGTRRGEHAHLAARQLLVCVTGRIEVAMRAEDAQSVLVLDEPASGLLIEPGVWAAQTYLTDDACLLVFCSEPFSPASYAPKEVD